MSEINNKFENLKNFFEKIKTIGFFQRIFKWRSVKNLSYEAYNEFNELLNKLINVSDDLEKTRNSVDVINKDIEYLKPRNLILENELERIREENTKFKQSEEGRKLNYEKNVSNLNAIRDQIQNERKEEQEDKIRKEKEKFELMKETWLRHQDNVKRAIKKICQKHVIDYVEIVPFKGNPDNTIKISDEYVVFEAKSPASEDLGNFYTYIKNQTESVKKYVKEENVKKDVYLVIPSNTVEVIEQSCYNMADYTVYVVTTDMLEPLILSLKKIEEYEFVEQLSPEERENICRVIGKFAHITKRRIQIDQFFERQFLEILIKCEADLPKEILDKVAEFEKSEKLNPPLEKRAKQILTADLETDGEKIKREAEAKEIIFPPSLDEIKKLPLYNEDK